MSNVHCFRRCKGTAISAHPQSHVYVILYTISLVYQLKSWPIMAKTQESDHIFSAVSPKNS